MDKVTKFATLGTCVGPEILSKSGRKDWTLVGSYISHSLMAIVDSYNSPDKIEIIDTTIFTNEKWKTSDLLDDINGNILNALSACNADLYLIDLCDFRLPEKIYELADGRKIYITNKPYSQETENKLDIAIENTYDSVIKSKKIKSFTALSANEQKQYVNNFIKLLSNTFGADNILIFRPKLITHYIDNGQIKRLNNYISSCKLNLLLNSIYSNCKDYINCPEILLGDPSYFSLFEFHYCKPYYNYLTSCILKKLSAGSVKEDYSELLCKCENEIYTIYNQIICSNIVDNFNSKLLLNKKIVLIAKTKYFGDLLTEKTKNKIFVYIPYNADSNLEELENKIKELDEREQNLFYIVPEVFYHGERQGIQKIFSDLGFSPNVNYFIYRPTVYLQDLIGYYNDIYNNIIESQSNINLTIHTGTYAKIGANSTFNNHKIHLESNSTFIVGNNVKAHDGIIYAGHNSCIKIGDRSEISDSDIRSHNRSHISIGNDCLFSYQQMIYSSDGHAIFEVLDDCGGNRRLNNPNNDTIIIGDHVWIGYRCHIITNTNIGNGSIVGAGSLTNRRYPNNCIIAGVPAKVIKINRAWSKNPYHLDLKNDKSTYEKYLNLTEGEN